MRSTSTLCTLDETTDLAPELKDIRHHLHQHPELAYKEFQTSDFVAETLERWGYEVTRGLAGTGMVASLKAGSSSRAVAVRADMDALRIAEQTGLPYASVNPGHMHACGHDGHTTMALGAACHLARTRRFDGIVHLVFQPAEEIGGSDSGAKRMIADGLFERFPCDAIFGLHNHPGYPAGTFMFRSGPFMSASDIVDIVIRGRSGHAARPHLAIDPVMIGAMLVVALQAVVSRSIDPMQTAVVTVGAFNAGHAANAIPETAHLRLSVRSFDAEVRKQLETRIRALTQSVVEGHGAEVEIDYVAGYPTVINSAAETELAAQVARELVGEACVIDPFDRIAGSEDFAYYLQRKPGCFLRLGNGEGVPMLHNASYDFNDQNLTIGAAYWTRLVERFLAPGQ
ncbi:Hippurate hydrolase [Paraburkholderia aspalathi]|uniref:M20 aminoacylase family protein n=1 Tax=Paraburkholderia aspalathi TaxID=1324617 RepID=UPI00190945B7|nr:M20 aminoacylase family protein [Paraburkholderia aspalathi]MBK3843654.1 amidohydrolase [Paraburkholderia aspalathi]CAE6812384.1 Hippurate hydrolase [Paraburkholderia aspalathi]CAE6857918.1 Hippurate hydrolase [Paraburkholderia aspalathi]